MELSAVALTGGCGQRDIQHVDELTDGHRISTKH